MKFDPTLRAHELNLYQSNLWANQSEDKPNVSDNVDDNVKLTREMGLTSRIKHEIEESLVVSSLDMHERSEEYHREQDKLSDRSLDDVPDILDGMDREYL